MKKNTKIGLISDPELSPQKTQLLNQKLNVLRQFSELEILKSETTESELLERLEKDPHDLILAPWKTYLDWARIEAHFGNARTSGPAFAGYYADKINSAELIDRKKDQIRFLLFDFQNSAPKEIKNLVQALTHEHLRCGIRPLLDPGTPVYCENWLAGQPMGTRSEVVLGLPDVADNGWQERANAIRICLMALWAFIYEEGPGKEQIGQSSQSKTPKAYLQVAADSHSLLLRLCFSMKNWKPSDAVSNLWPDADRSTKNLQLITRYSDFVRVHMIGGTPDLEMVVGFQASAPAERNPEGMRTVWVEPIAQKLVTEIPAETPGQNAPHLRVLPHFAEGTSTLKKATVPAPTQPDKNLTTAREQIRKLKTLLVEKDELVKDLRMGGVGTAKTLPPPDAEGLLSAFQERYFEARYQIRQFEIQIEKLESEKASQFEIQKLKKKIEALQNRLSAWVKKLATTLKDFQEFRKSKKDSG